MSDDNYHTASGFQRQPALRPRVVTIRDGNITGGKTPPRLSSPPPVTGTGAPPPPRPVDRRRSSMMSELSIDDMRQTLKSSTENIKNDLVGGDQTGGAWHWLPLAFVFLPIAAGLVFHNGTHFLTDLLLLVGAFWVMSGSVKEPWEWYTIAQAETALLTEEAEAHHSSDTILEADEAAGDEAASDGENRDSSSNSSPTSRKGVSFPSTFQEEQDAAIKASSSREVYYLTLCFLVPLIVAMVLYQVRIQLARPSDGLVSSIDLRIWLLVAEVRPMLLLIRRAASTTVSKPSIRPNIDGELTGAITGRPARFPTASPIRSELDEVKTQLRDLETQLTSTDSAHASTVESVKQSIQPQLDALNRAVRRYEKRSATQTIQTEARMQQMELRIRDALALAELAARRSTTESWWSFKSIWRFIGRILIKPFEAALFVLQWPLQLSLRIIQAFQSVVPDAERKAKVKRRLRTDPQTLARSQRASRR